MDPQEMKVSFRVILKCCGVFLCTDDSGKKWFPPVLVSHFSFLYSEAVVSNFARH